MNKQELAHNIWQEKMDALLIERKELNQKIKAWKSARKSLFDSSANIDIRPHMSACQTRIMAILSDSGKGLTIDEIKNALVNNNYMYSDETVRTELSRLKDFQIRYDKTDSRYYHILSSNIKADNLGDAVVNVITDSNAPLSVKGVHNILISSGYDLSVYENPRRKLTAIISRLKRKELIVLSHKEGRTGYYENSRKGTRDSLTAKTQNL